MYADGALPHHEDDPLDVSADGDLGVTAKRRRDSERQVLQAPLEGIVLRYGLFNGPAPGFLIALPARYLCILTQLLKATALAVTEAPPGIYNVADPNSIVSATKLNVYRVEFRLEDRPRLSRLTISPIRLTIESLTACCARKIGGLTVCFGVRQ